MVRTGSSVYITYGYEGSFGGGATRNKNFGLDQKIPTISSANNSNQIAELNSQVVTGYWFGQNRYNISFDFILSNPWLFQGILNTLTTGAPTSATYPHTFSLGANDKVIKSLELEWGFAGQTANVVRKFQGTIMKSLNISSSVGSAVRCGLELESGKMPTTTTSLGTAGTDSENFPYTFAYGKLEFPTSTEMIELQSVDMTLDTQGELVYGHNSPDAVGAYRKLQLFSGKFNKPMVDKTFIDYVNDASLGRKEVASTLTLIFTTGTLGSTMKEISLVGTGAIIPSHSNGSEAGEPVWEDIEYQFRSLVVTARNPTSTAP